MACRLSSFCQRGKNYPCIMQNTRPATGDHPSRPRDRNHLSAPFSAVATDVDHICLKWTTEHVLLLLPLSSAGAMARHKIPLIPTRTNSDFAGWDSVNLLLRYGTCADDEFESIFSMTVELLRSICVTKIQQYP